MLMEIQCDAIHVKARLSGQSEPDGDRPQSQSTNTGENTGTINNQVEQIEKSLKRYIDKQFQQFTKQKRP